MQAVVGLSGYRIPDPDRLASPVETMFGLGWAILLALEISIIVYLTDYRPDLVS